MCVSPGTLMAISTGVNVAGQLSRGIADSRAATADARAQELAAAQERDSAMAEAARIRKAGARASGAARAQLAASGVDVGAGTALLIDEDITSGAETDAEYTLLTGDRRARAYENSASQSRAKGRNAVAASVLGATASGLQGWKAIKEQKTPPPAIGGLWS